MNNYLILGATLFALGLLGFLTRRNLILMMLSAELMLHGVSLNLTAFSQAHHHYQGQAFTVFVLTVAACEAGIALALILTLYHRTRSLDVANWYSLGESTPPPPKVEQEAVESAPAIPPPRLTISGRMPQLKEDDEEIMTNA